MKIAKDTVVSLRYELFDANGSLWQKRKPPSATCTAASGTFPTVEERYKAKT